MKNKLVLIIPIILSLALGFIAGYFVRKSENRGGTISDDVDNYKVPDSTMRRALDMPNYCNEKVVEANVRKNFRFYYPTTEIIENSMEIQELGECLYHVRLKARKGYVRKILILEFSYDYTFSKYFIKTLRETNY
jgi:hypothetical protein